MKPAIGDYIEVYDPMDRTVLYSLSGILLSKRKKHPLHTWLDEGPGRQPLVYEVLCAGKVREFDEPYWAIRLTEER